MNLVKIHDDAYNNGVADERKRCVEIMENMEKSSGDTHCPCIKFSIKAINNQDMDKNLKIKCPVCKGTGKITKSKKTLAELRKEMARTLRKAGYSYGQISFFLGWKSRQSAHKAITNNL